MTSSWLFGAGATRAERLIVVLTVGICLLVLNTIGPSWEWWRRLVVAALVLDVVGGVVANGLGSAKLVYTRGSPQAPVWGRWFMTNHVLFAAAHLHPFVLAALFVDVSWLRAALWYLVAVGGVITVRSVALYLQRPIALSIVTISVVLAATVDATSLSWFGPVLALKLVLAHAVVEQPFRPGDDESTASPNRSAG